MVGRADTGPQVSTSWALRTPTANRFLLLLGPRAHFWLAPDEAQPVVVLVRRVAAPAFLFFDDWLWLGCRGLGWAEIHLEASQLEAPHAMALQQRQHVGQFVGVLDVHDSGISRVGGALMIAG